MNPPLPLPHFLEGLPQVFPKVFQTPSDGRPSPGGRSSEAFQKCGRGEGVFRKTFQKCGRPSRSVEGLPEVFPPMGPDRGGWGRGRGGWGRIPWPPSPRGPDRGHPCHGGAHPLAQPKGMAFFDGRDDPAVKKGQGRNGSAGSPGEDLGRPPAQFWKGCGRPPGKDASELAPVGASVGGKLRQFRR